MRYKIRSILSRQQRQETWLTVVIKTRQETSQL